MKYFFLIFLVVFSCLSSTSQLVVHVQDGDTYKILRDGKLHVIRLANVDAPELNQYYGTIVKQRVSKLILGKTVLVDYGKKDSFGRVIAKVTVEGKRLDSLLIANGWAWNYLPYSRYEPLLSVYESKARQIGLGMWHCLHNVPPWIWRQLNSKQKRLNEMCR